LFLPVRRLDQCITEERDSMIYCFALMPRWRRLLTLRSVSQQG
jgi:hypothetical protein